MEAQNQICQFCKTTFECPQELRCHQVNEHGDLLLNLDPESHRQALGIKPEKNAEHGIGSSASKINTSGPPVAATATIFENQLVVIKTEKLDGSESESQKNLEAGAQSKLSSISCPSDNAKLKAVLTNLVQFSRKSKSLNTTDSVPSTKPAGATIPVISSSDIAKGSVESAVIPETLSKQSISTISASSTLESVVSLPPDLTVPSSITITKVMGAVSSMISPFRPLAAVKPRVHENTSSSTAKRCLNEDSESTVPESIPAAKKPKSSQPDSAKNLPGSSEQLTAKDFIGDSSSAACASIIQIGDLEKVQDLQATIQPEVESSKSSTKHSSGKHKKSIPVPVPHRTPLALKRVKKNKRKPSTRLSTDKVSFPKVQNIDAAVQHPESKHPEVFLHVPNVSQLPSNICPQEPCFAEIPEFTKSVRLETEVEEYNSRNIFSKTLWLWPPNLNIVPSVEIRCLSVKKVKAWVNKETSLQQQQAEEKRRRDAMPRKSAPATETVAPISIQKKLQKTANKKTHPTEYPVILPDAGANRPKREIKKPSKLDSESETKKVSAEVVDEKAKDKPECDKCGFIAKSPRGLHTHMKRSHPETQVEIQTGIEFMIQEDIQSAVKESRESPVKHSSKVSESPRKKEQSEDTASEKSSETEEPPPAEPDEEWVQAPSTSQAGPSRGRAQGSGNRKRCLHCNFIGKTHAAFLSHLRKVHPDTPELGTEDILGVECPICQKIYPNRNAADKTFFQEHLEIHQGLRPFVCPFCEKGFKDPMRLVAHASVHNGEGYFDCVKCGEKMWNQTNLSLHMRICK